MVGKRRSTWRQSGYPAPRQWQKSLRGHILMFRYQTGNMEGRMSKFSHVDHCYYLITADMFPCAKAVCTPWSYRRMHPSESLPHFALKRKKIFSLNKNVTDLWKLNSHFQFPWQFQALIMANVYLQYYGVTLPRNCYENTIQ